jgi:hypothetical protein
MALGKKKQRDDPAAAGAEAPEGPDDGAKSILAADEPATDDGQLIAGVAPEEEGEAAKPAEPLAGGTDALLSMFQATEVEGDDRSVLLDLAGEVDLADLLEDLHTMAAALCIDLSVAA